jgi:hypothetical protein
VRWRREISMQLSDEVVSALIAGGVSLLVSLITYLTTKRQMSLEREKLERQLKRQFTERLYDLRLQYYPEAFRITEGLHRSRTDAEEDLFSYFQSIREQLKRWKAGEASFILSDAALEAFYELQRVLKKNPEKGVVYSETQIDNIWRARNRLRGALRGDLGLLFREDEKYESES